MLIDTHAHLMDTAFANDLPAVLERAAKAGVVALVCVGYDEPSSFAAVELAEQYPQLVAAVGVHPNASGAAAPGAFERLAKLARHPRVVGIGETGLDNFRKRTAPAIQQEWFRRHLDLAAELDLPVIVHNRDADDDVAPIIAEWAQATGGRGVLHCFSGDDAMLVAGLDAGFTVSIAGPITYKNAGDAPARAARVPLDRIVVETDCPYLPPHPHRGQRNEPAHIRLTASRLAGLHGVPVETFEDASTRNAVRLFPLLATLVPDTVTSERGVV
ncbi:MAG: TatD family hydrolase [Chloroflexi bacterium]|nr:TatD family hydrolase [Chloroflexota bacterium]